MYASSRVMAASAYSSATPALVISAAHAMAVEASASAMLVTRLFPTRTGGPAHGGRSGVIAPGVSIS